MISKKKNLPPDYDQVDSMISEGFVYEGNIVKGNSLRLEGHVKGNIKISGNLIVGKNAEVIGNVEAQNIQIIGKIKGHVIAENQLKLFSSCILLGDITVRNFIMDEGAVFLGKCNMPSIDKKLKAEIEEYQIEKAKNDNIELIAIDAETE